MLPFCSFRTIRVANEVPLFFYTWDALIFQPLHRHRPEDDAGMADSPTLPAIAESDGGWLVPAPTRHMHFISGDA